jgi:hypothetical protein
MKYVVEMDSGSHDVHTKLHTDWFRHSKLNGTDIQRQTDSMAISRAYFIFFKIRDVG